MTQLDNFLPEKTVKITSDDQPWINKEIKQLDRQRKREYFKNKKSDQWVKINENFQKKCSEAKSNYSKNMVNDLKSSNPKQWFSKVKRMSSIDKSKNQDTIIEGYSEIPDEEQVELIADSFEKISKEYDPLSSDAFPPSVLEASKHSRSAVNIRTSLQGQL